ncbi:hypothetical protein BDF14DRAFT_697574 [Spinellus fusiger]|nr:hypothetical protein BDF14DRAFT_697574 [Spinellus fusiger]
MAAEEKDRGNGYFKAGDAFKAILHYRRAIELDGTVAVYYINRAMAYLKLKEYNKVIDDCTIGLGLQPDNVKALWRRSTAYTALGNTEKAKKDLERLLRLEPGNEIAKAELKSLKESKKNFPLSDSNITIPSPPTALMAKKTLTIMEVDKEYKPTEDYPVEDEIVETSSFSVESRTSNEPLITVVDDKEDALVILAEAKETHISKVLEVKKESEGKGKAPEVGASLETLELEESPKVSDEPAEPVKKTKTRSKKASAEPKAPKAPKEPKHPKHPRNPKNPRTLTRPRNLKDPNSQRKQDPKRLQLNQKHPRNQRHSNYPKHPRNPRNPGNPKNPKHPRNPRNPGNPKNPKNPKNQKNPRTLTRPRNLKDPNSQRR